MGKREKDARCLQLCVLVTKTVSKSSMLTGTGSVLEVGELKPPYAGTCLSQGSAGGQRLGELTFLTVGRTVATAQCHRWVTEAENLLE